MSEENNFRRLAHAIAQCSEKIIFLKRDENPIKWIYSRFLRINPIKWILRCICAFVAFGDIGFYHFGDLNKLFDLVSDRRFVSFILSIRTRGDGIEDPHVVLSQHRQEVLEKVIFRRTSSFEECLQIEESALQFVRDAAEIIVGDHSSRYAAAGLEIFFQHTAEFIV